MSAEPKKEDIQEQPAAAEGGEAVAEKKGMSMPLKLGLFVGGPLFLIGAIVGVLFFLGVLGSSDEAAAAEEVHKKEAEAVPLKEQLHEVFSFPLPSMLINLRTTGKRTSFLKITMSLEVKGNEENKKEIELVKPRIIDQFQTYLRELEVDDLQGSAGLQRLKEELLDRVNAVTAPVVVQNVLFSELLVQ